MQTAMVENLLSPVWHPALVIGAQVRDPPAPKGEMDSKDEAHPELAELESETRKEDQRKLVYEADSS